ncbi:ATP-dependent helicase [Candidatus Parcubacteria bacterium]|nr:ATP-dependent helicase [Candidatus Parcubacteria bacterium]
MSDDLFKTAYKSLNKAQKEAVDAIEGPVMVIAGPGTGKTQVLTLRIANILTKTDTPADGILCLTFTNSGVKAMRERLLELIGPAASRVVISTFHSFGSSLIEEFYERLDLPAPPKLLDERDAVLLVDEILESNDWEYLRPRSGGAHNFRDLRSLISFLKREKISPEDFALEVGKEIKKVKDKAKLKSLGRTEEASRFYKLYEEAKRERNIVDYDDILEYIVRLAESSKDARASLRERYLYVLVDEHQDSSGVQNKFLEAVWSDTEKPNIFVVGDDRQLIYGFGGASLSHFESFKDSFAGTKLISLSENYRSTEPILELADEVLVSSISKVKLKSNRSEKHAVTLVEAEYPRDEILAAGLAIKKRIEEGVNPDECAVIVPKNAQVRSAVAVLQDLGLPVAASGKASFFNLHETETLIDVLRFLVDPYDAASTARLILNPVFGIPVLTGHAFLREEGRKVSIDSVLKAKGKIGELGDLLAQLLKLSKEKDVYELVQEIGKQVFYKTSDHKTLLRQIESVRTMLHLALSRLERDPKTSPSQFVAFIDRLIEYSEDIPLAVFLADEGVKVMTLHASKGLEFDSVWIAHLDEKSLMKGKRAGFVLPEKIAQFAAEKDELSARRELYVAITRAKRYLTLSYAAKSYTGGEQALAHIVASLPKKMLVKKSVLETESAILGNDPSLYVTSNRREKTASAVEEMRELVKKNVADMSISVTNLNNFWSCPWKWYFRSFLRLPEPESESLVFGDLVHKLINRQLKEGSFRHDFRQEIEDFLDELHVYDELSRRRYFKDADKVLSAFQDAILPHISEDFATEKSLRYVDPNVNMVVTGKLDLVEQLEDGTMRVSDFKTGGAKTTGAIEKVSEGGRLSDMLRQLAMYSYLLENQRKSGEISSSRLIFLEASEKDKNFIYETQMGKEEIGLLKKDIVDFAKLLSSGEWTELPCDNDSYGKPCEYCALKDLLLKK